MNKYQDKLSLSLNGIFIVAALIILIDFIVPGKVVNDDVINVKRERQQYYNAARNYHYSYKIITNEHQFWVTEDFARMVQNNQPIKYSVSPVFNEVNWYRLLTSNNRAIYSLRIISGFVIPLLVIISIGLALIYQRRNSIFIFVLKSLLIADYIFLIY